MRKDPPFLTLLLASKFEINMLSLQPVMGYLIFYLKDIRNPVKSSDLRSFVVLSHLMDFV